MQKWVQPVASPGLVVLYPPMPWPPQAASRKMANQVPVLDVVQSNGVAKGIGEGTLAVTGGEAGESGAAVAGE